MNSLDFMNKIFHHSDYWLWERLPAAIMTSGELIAAGSRSHPQLTRYKAPDV
jgi:hypothetical protein